MSDPGVNGRAIPPAAYLPHQAEIQRAWPTASGGSTGSSIRSIRVRSRIATATASATCNGIRARLDYLRWLGVDAVWISPIYPSPMADFGYDVADYRGIDPLFGTLDGFRPADRRGACARHEGHPRLRAEPHLRPASLVPRKPRFAATTRSATGTSGATGTPTAGRPTTGSRISAARPGRCDDAHRPILSAHASCASSRTSTGATRTCARPCTTCCASGSTAASTAFASTSSGT